MERIREEQLRKQRGKSTTATASAAASTSHAPPRPPTAPSGTAVTASGLTGSVLTSAATPGTLVSAQALARGVPSASAPKMSPILTSQSGSGAVPHLSLDQESSRSTSSGDSTLDDVMGKGRQAAVRTGWA